MAKNQLRGRLPAPVLQAAFQEIMGDGSDMVRSFVQRSWNQFLLIQHNYAIVSTKKLADSEIIVSNFFAKLSIDPACFIELFGDRIGTSLSS